MLRFVTACVGVALLALPAVAFGAEGEVIVVSTGRDAGSYYYIGTRLKREMLVTHDQPVVVRTSEGSLDNLSRLNDPKSPVNVALVQADALKVYLGEHPDFSESFFLLGEVGKECAFLIARKDGIARAADLKSEAEKQVSVDAPGSGAAVTLATMGELDAGYRNAEPVFVPTMEALLQLKVGGEFTKLVGVLLVQRPRRASPPLETVLLAPDIYRLVPITKDDLPNTKLPDGSDVYSFERVAAGGKDYPQHVEIDTLCTRGLLIGARNKLSRELRGQLSSVMLESGSRIAGADE